jgi:hypothetical protein
MGDGSSDDPGLVPRIADDILTRLTQRSDLHANLTLSLHVEMIEIYDDHPYDLLANDKPRLRIREHPTRGPYCEGCTSIMTDRVDDLVRLIESGQRRRTMSATSANLTSSRSHAIVTLCIRQVDETNGSTVVSFIQLVDLAGSERQSNHAPMANGAGEEELHQQQTHLKESSGINSSLTVLGRVITDLAEFGQSHAFRQSKLTFLLRTALDGDARVWLIATICPLECNGRDTIRTLDYASRAMHVKTRPIVQSSQRFVDGGECHDDKLSAVIGENSQMKRQLSRMKIEMDKMIGKQIDWERVRDMVKVKPEMAQHNQSIVSRKVKALLQHRERVQQDNRQLQQLLERPSDAAQTVLPILDFAIRHGMLCSSILNQPGSISDIIRIASTRLKAPDRVPHLSVNERDVIEKIMRHTCSNLDKDSYDIEVIVDADHEKLYLSRASHLLRHHTASSNDLVRPRLVFWDSSTLSLDGFVSNLTQIHRYGLPKDRRPSLGNASSFFVRQVDNDNIPLLLCEAMTVNIAHITRSSSPIPNGPAARHDAVIITDGHDRWSLGVTDPFQAIPRYRIARRRTAPAGHDDGMTKCQPTCIIL